MAIFRLLILRVVNRGRWWPHIWISDPDLPNYRTTFDDATMTIKGSLFVSIAIVKAFLSWFLVQIYLCHVICKKQVVSLVCIAVVKAVLAEIFWFPSKIGPDYSFGRNCGRTVKFSFPNPQKAPNDVIWHIYRQNRCRRLGCKASPKPGLTPQKEKKTSRVALYAVRTAHVEAGRKKLLIDHNKVLHSGSGPRPHLPCHWTSVQGLWWELGSNFAPFHWLALSSLKHLGTTMRACDMSERYSTYDCISILTNCLIGLST